MKNLDKNTAPTESVELPHLPEEAIEIAQVIEQNPENQASLNSLSQSLSTEDCHLVAEMAQVTNEGGDIMSVIGSTDKFTRWSRLMMMATLFALSSGLMAPDLATALPSNAGYRAKGARKINKRRVAKRRRRVRKKPPVVRVKPKKSPAKRSTPKVARVVEPPKVAPQKPNNPEQDNTHLWLMLAVLMAAAGGSTWYGLKKRKENKDLSDKAQLAQDYQQVISKAFSDWNRENPQPTADSPADAQ